MGFSSQESLSGLPCPPPGNLPDPGIKPESLTTPALACVKVKVESEKVGLKLNIQKTKIMASGPITSWEIHGVLVETVSDLIFLGSNITADGDCRHEIKRRLLLGRKVTQTKRWAEGIRVPGPLAGGGSTTARGGLPHCRWILYQLSHKGSPRILEWVAYPFPMPHCCLLLYPILYSCTHLSSSNIKAGK